jgi:hypothetical protein
MLEASMENKFNKLARPQTSHLNQRGTRWSTDTVILATWEARGRRTMVRDWLWAKTYDPI